MGHKQSDVRPVYGVRSSEPATDLEMLVAQFREAAQALDPSIKKVWIGYDETMNGPRGDRVMSFYLEREHAPLARKVA